MVFDKYAKYYDVLYSDIDYKKDCIRIREMTDKYFINTKKRISLVDLGCGSGTHSLIFNNMGFDVIGVDSSEQMIDIARKKNNNNIFYVGDIANFTLSKQVDIAVSLGQITSYLITDEKLDSFFKTTYANVVDGGLFIFDMWCGHGVLTEKTETRKKKINNNTYRTATATTDLENQIVEVKYVIKENGEEIVKETHHMRYYFPREIKKAINDAGFELLTQTPKRLDYNTWRMLMVCRKNG